MIELDMKGLPSLKKKFSNVFVHDAAELAPPLEGERFDSYCVVRERYPEVEIERVVAVRVAEPDGHFNGSIAVLSGRTEIEACRRSGREVRITLYEGSQPPVELAASLNLLHDHPTTSQLGAKGVELEDLIAPEAKKNQKASGGENRALLSKLTKALPATICKTPSAPDALHSRKLAASIVGTSEGTIWKTRKVREANPVLFLKIKKREVTLEQARRELTRQADRNDREVRAASPFLRSRSLDEGIRLGDCLKHLPSQPDNKFQLWITDPPYNIGIDYGNGSKADQLSEPKYLEYCERWIAHVPRLLTPTGSAVIIIDKHHAAEIAMMMKRQHMELRDWITWYETFGTNCTKKFNNTSRHILHFAKDAKRCIFHADVFNRPSDRLTKYGDVRADPWGKVWDDVWKIPRLPDGDPERVADFPCQIPLALEVPLIEGLTNPGDWVIDNHSGSGTTAHACEIAQPGRRRFVGFEINAEYVKWSLARLAKAGGKK